MTGDSEEEDAGLALALREERRRTSQSGRTPPPPWRARRSSSGNAPNASRISQDGDAAGEGEGIPRSLLSEMKAVAVDKRREAMVRNSGSGSRSEERSKTEGGQAVPPPVSPYSSVTITYESLEIVHRSHTGGGSTSSSKAEIVDVMRMQSEEGARSSSSTSLHLPPASSTSLPPIRRSSMDDSTLPLSKESGAKMLVAPRESSRHHQQRVSGSGSGSGLMSGLLSSSPSPLSSEAMARKASASFSGGSGGLSATALPDIALKPNHQLQQDPGESANLTPTPTHTPVICHLSSIGSTAIGSSTAP